MEQRKEERLPSSMEGAISQLKSSYTIRCRSSPVDQLSSLVLVDGASGGRPSAALLCVHMVQHGGARK